MNDSSDEDDLEALRLEALKSLKPRNQASTTVLASSFSADIDSDRKSHRRNQSWINEKDDFSPSKQTHEHSPSHRNTSFGREESSQGRSLHRHEDRNKSNHHLDSHSSSKLDYNFSRSFDRKSSIRERPFAKQNADSSHRNVRNFRRKFDNSRRRTYNSIDNRRNARLRRSHSPGGLSSSNSIISRQKYPAKYQDPKSISPSNRRKSKSPHRSTRDFGRRPLPKSGTVEACRDEKSADSISSLPLCSPKHYVELFYGKKLATNNLSDLSDPSLVINDEDRALLSEKSNSEKEVIQSAPNELPKNNGEFIEPIQEPVSSKLSSSAKGILSQQVRRIEESLRSSLSPRLSKSRDRIHNERLTRPRPRRVICERSHRDAEHDDRSPSHRISSGLDTSERGEFEEQTNKPLVKTDEPLDPVLEARRKKFESNDIVKVVPKRIKLTNQPVKTDSIQTDEPDLRDLLIAKHRGKLMSAALCIKENIDSENSYTMSASSPSNVPVNFDEGSISAKIDKKALDSSYDSNYSPPMNNEELASHSESDQVKVKVEVETDIDQSLIVETPENLSSTENLEPPSGSLNIHSTNEPASYLANGLASNTENIPVFESADYTCSVAIKKEPVFNEVSEESSKVDKGSPKIEEKPVIDEPCLIPQQPDNPEDSIASAPVIKIKPLTELLDKKVLKKVKKSKKKGEKSSKKRKKKSKSKDKDRENHSSKFLKRASKILSQGVLTKEAFPTRIVRSALAEALGKKKRKVFESESEAVIRTTSLEQHTSKDHRKVLILDEPEEEEEELEEPVCRIEEESPEEPSSPSVALSEKGTDNPFEEDLKSDSLRFRLSSKAPLYSSKKAIKRPDIYKMIQFEET